MKSSTVLSLSTDPATLRRRSDLLKLNGFEVVSVNGPAKARFDIEMGRCGIFISYALVSDGVNADLFALFKKFCQTG